MCAVPASFVEIVILRFWLIEPKSPPRLRAIYPALQTAGVPVIAWVVRALGVYSAAGVQIVSFPELPISIRAGMTVASGLLFSVGLLSRLSFGRNGRQKPEADATAFERLLALADQTENSPAHKAVEARPSYCQQQQQRQAKGMRGSTAQNRQPSRAAHSPISLSHAPRSLQPDARL